MRRPSRFRFTASVLALVLSGMFAVSAGAFTTSSAVVPLATIWPDSCEESETFPNPLDPESTCTASGTIVEIIPDLCFCKADCDPGGPTDFSIPCPPPH